MNTPQVPKQTPIDPIYIILAIALLIRLAWVLYTPALPVSDFVSYNGLAHRLVDGLGYSSTYRVPGYPFFLAGLYILFGDELLVPKLANAILGTLTCLFTYLIADKAFSRKEALIAAGIVALLPSHVLYAGLLATESLFTCLMLGSTALFLFALERMDRRWLLLMASGFVLGLAALVRPIALFLPGMWMFLLLWKRYTLPNAILMILVVGGMTILVFSPWIIRNYSLSGKFVIQTNGGMNWLMGFNERANGYYLADLRREFEEEAKSMGLDQYEADELAYQRAFQFIRERPGRAIALIPLKWFHLFKHDVSGVVWNSKETSRPFSPVLWYILVFVGQGYYMVLMILALVGFLSLSKYAADYPYHHIALGFILFWLAFHAVTIGVDRFHIPLLPILAMYAAVGLLGIWQRFHPILTRKRRAQ